jgi:hypothetical protein
MCPPRLRDVTWLLTLLVAYDQPGLWLRIWQVDDGSGCPDQGWLEVVDAQGVALADRGGWRGRYIVPEGAAWLPALPGQSVPLSGEGEWGWLHILPAAAVVGLGVGGGTGQDQLSA